jgi:phosphoglycolate phosphatase-like HAD superfamily hydrolase
VDLLENVRAVVLDCDGTVLDTMSEIAEIASNVMKRFYAPTGSAWALRRMYMQSSGVPFEEQMATLFGHVRGSSITEFEKEKSALMATAPVFPDVATFLEHARSRHMPVFLCTSSRIAYITDIVSRLALPIAGVSAVDTCGPKDRQLRAWASVAGVSLEQVLFVGDSAKDAQFALQAGTRFCGLCRRGIESPPKFAPTTVVIETLTELIHT